jgi:hypothetical protein
VKLSLPSRRAASSLVYDDEDECMEEKRAMLARYRVRA